MIWLVLLMALFLRLVNLNQSLWLDEAINVVFAKSSDFWWFMTKYPVGDFHPPGWFAILWGWGHIFGFSEISVRLPSVILGVGTVGLTYLLGRNLFNKRVGLLSSLFLAIAPLHVYYSQEARMYVFAAFAVCLSFYFLNGVIQKRKLFGLGYAVSLVIVLTSDYLAYFIIPAQIIYLIWIKKLKGVALTAYLVSGLVFLPWLYVFPSQFKIGMNKALSLPAWTMVVGSSLKDLLLLPIKILLGRVSFLNKTLYGAIAAFCGLAIGSIFIYGLKKIDEATKLLLCWIFIPLTLAFLVSFIIPVLSYFRMIFILPAFYLILAKGIENLPKKFALPAIIFILLVSLSSVFGYYFNPGFHREDWKGAVNFVSKNLDANTIVLFENNEIPAPIKYYNPDLSNFKPGLSENLVYELADKNKVFLFEYLIDIYDPKRLVQQRLKDLKFVETDVYNFQGVGLIRLYIKV